MIWGAFSTAGVGNLVKIEGRMTGASYVQLLADNLLDSASKIGLGSFIFQQDNDPKHTSKVARAFIEENSIEKLDWAPQSPDLNPIEHLWSILDSKIEMNKRRNLEMFWTELQRQWELISPDTLCNLVHSMPRRLQAVIDNKGGNTKF